MRNVPRGTLGAETKELIAIFQWINVHHSIAHKFIHVPNEGKRSVAHGRILKLMGLRPGVPDIIGLLPRRGYHGLIIEHKSMQSSGKYGKPSPEQLFYIEEAQKDGYFAKVTYGLDDAIDTLKWYIS